MKEYKCEQGSEEWSRVRSGLFTASYAGVAFPLPSKLKKGVIQYSEKRGDYMYKLAVEKILGRPYDLIEPDAPVTGGLYWPARGIRTEPEAAEALERYAAERQLRLGKLKPAGFCTTDDGTIGCSPDRWVTNTKISVEIKCPAPGTQAEYLDANDDYWKKEHYPQVQCQMLVTGYQHVILFCYHPRMPPVFRKTARDQYYINTLEAEIVKFNGELATKVANLRKLGGWKPFEKNEK